MTNRETTARSRRQPTPLPHTQVGELLETIDGT